MNRLAGEKSPYLQMHRENPVDWYPWGEEAFSAAKAADKPVFLSVGYSSCHWCHVIAHESFEDAEVAEILNAEYIAVKVDKEERPDVDAVYMDAVELATGAGGWPLSIFMTAEGQPFFAATYLPREARDGMAGLKEVLINIARLWREERSALTAAAEELTGRMRALADRPVALQIPDAQLTARAVKAYAENFDFRWGGFGRAPKFPAAHNLLFLLSHSQRADAPDALVMAEETLAAMYRGGIFDHIGGGFCRYSTDRIWLMPHFEKMLYDNALLLWAYAEAWRITRKPLYKRVAARTADYVLREMTGPEGAFFCSQNADSEGREGAFYVFSREEMISLLGQTDGARFCEWYGISQNGNFEGKSIPNRIGQDDLTDADMDALRTRVYEYRAQRMVLERDDKVLTAWNALMIVALCRAAKALDAPEYADAARRAEAFLRARLTRAEGEVLLWYAGGEAGGNGMLTDYANYVLALTELFEVTGEKAYADFAEGVASAFLDRFLDREQGGLFLYSKQGERLITRPKDIWDTAMPSGNSSAAMALHRLYQCTGEAAWRWAADAQMRFVAGAAEAYPTGCGFGLLAISQYLQ